MRLWSMAFLIGIVSLNFFNPLPAVALGYQLAVTVILIAVGLNQVKNLAFINSILPLLLCSIALLLGWCWMLMHVQWQLAHRIPPSMQARTVVVRGDILSVPELDLDYQHFEFKMMEIADGDHFVPVNYKVRLAWYGKNLPRLTTGAHWQLAVRLKQPHSTYNPGGFDYERWLFEHKINAVGYVVTHPLNQCLAKSGYYYQLIDRVRQHLNNGINSSLQGREGKGLIAALVIGIRNNITPTQWRIMQATGTNHLMAIAGLHLGFVSGFIFCLSSWLWRRSNRLPLYVPAPQMAAVAALIVAFLYSCLAGFALPTQRAVIMLAVFLLTSLLRRNIPTWQAWSVAMLIIVIIEPLAVLADSFWLSFGAVAIIIYGVSGRLNPQGIWWTWFRVQWVIGLGLIPLTLLFFQMFSGVSLLANALAIPWVGFVVLPLCLFAAVLYPVFPVGGSYLWQFAEYLLAPAWKVLAWFASLTAFQWQGTLASNWIFCTTLIGILFLIAPRGLPGRWLGAFWLLPLWFWTPPRPPLDELWFTLLDVGQGLSAVVSTSHHTLVFDAGPKFNNQSDMGSAVVVPFLQLSGIKSLDALVISHADNDHRGGAQSIIKAMPVAAIFSSVPELFAQNRARYCNEGVAWQWDNVNFEFINTTLQGRSQKNNNSCVLKIVFGKQQILLPGDIERAGEKYLVEHYGQQLKSTIVVAPHHGSRTSSSEAFVKWVHPEYVLFATGYLNRFHFPNPVVIARYQQLGATAFTTAEQGAITFKLKPRQLSIELWRTANGYYWNSQ